MAEFSTPVRSGSTTEGDHRVPRAEFKVSCPFRQTSSNEASDSEKEEETLLQQLQQQQHHQKQLKRQILKLMQKNPNLK